MKTGLALQVLVIMAAARCGPPPPEPVAALDLVAHSDLADPKGLAGIEVGVDVEGTVWPQGFELRFTAADIADTVRLGIWDGGTVAVTARLAQDGRTVAEGTAEWESELVYWHLWILRDLYPYGDSVDLDNPQCRPFARCHGVWRFPIAEEDANFEDEALWLVLWRRCLPGLECD